MIKEQSKMQELGHNIHMKLKEEFLPESKFITKL